MYHYLSRESAPTDDPFTASASLSGAADEDPSIAAEAWAAKHAFCPDHGDKVQFTSEVMIDHYCRNRQPSWTMKVWLYGCPSCVLRRRGIPPLLDACSFDNFETETNIQRQVLEKMKEYAAAPRGFVFLLGPPGTGKSHLTVACLRELGCGLYRRHLDLVEELRESYRPRTRLEDSIESVARKYKEARILALDEIGVAGAGNDAETLLYNILDHRMTNFGPTILCANLGANEIEGALGSRLADRFRQAAFAVLNLPGTSHRSRANESYLERAARFQQVRWS